ncbi:MAG: DUF2087 domain-containing protein [Elainellaceae cyanobacterium]
MSNLAELANYLDQQGRVKEWPSKRNRSRFRPLVLEYLASKFEFGVTYTEREVNAILNAHHTFGDPALLRRELFEHQFLNRKLDGSAYWLNPLEGISGAAHLD